MIFAENRFRSPDHAPASDTCYDANISAQIARQIAAALATKNLPAQIRTPRIGPPPLVGARHARKRCARS
jgi:hypothetical protein